MVAGRHTETRDDEDLLAERASPQWHDRALAEIPRAVAAQQSSDPWQAQRDNKRRRPEDQPDVMDFMDLVDSVDWSARRHLFAGMY